MASSMPLVTTGLRRPPSTSSDDDGPNGGGGRRNEDPLNWCAWAHQGHRLWVGMPDSFWVFTYKVERCRLPGEHVWMSCPYAHRGERARRRDPRRFPYVAAPCPEYEESKRQLRLAKSSAAPACARGLRCGYAHGTFETWLHPTRFRTVMCQRGAECARRVCFFAHCLAQCRREDDEVPLVVFPATTTAQPPPLFVPRPPRLTASASASVVSRRPNDRAMLQQGHNVRLLTRRSAGASSSCSTSPVAVVATTAAATAPATLSPLLEPEASLSPADDEDIDFVAIVTNCCLASEADSRAVEGRSVYPHFMDIARSTCLQGSSMQCVHLDGSAPREVEVVLDG